jgi:hypothetical protein
MTITIQTSGIHEIEQLLLILKSMNIKSVNVQPTHSTFRPIISKGDKKLDPTELFGIWKENPKTIEQIRQISWKRN